MLKITIPGNETFNEFTEEFVTTKGCTLQLEHSLVSLSKWESKWKKPFLDKKLKSYDEWTDYVRCMNMTQNVDPNVYQAIPSNVMISVQEYIDDSMTATWFSGNRKPPIDRSVITAEIIYYWMVSLGIPFECEKWHLNRLLTLIRVCDIKNAPGKKMSQREILNSYNALNNARRKATGSRG